MKGEANDGRRRIGGALVLATVLAAAATAGVAALLMNIRARKDEAQSPFFRVVEITDETVDPAVWGRNFPYQYDTYRRTVDQVRTRYGGSEAVPRTRARTAVCRSPRPSSDSAAASSYGDRNAAAARCARWWST